MSKPINWPELHAGCVAFAQRLIQTPSMPTEEAAIAALVADQLHRLGFADVGIDAAGNVTGRVRGREPALGAMVLNAHLDHVDPGDPSLWSTPPFAAAKVDGFIVGRGASDIKGPLAVQVYAMAALIQHGRQPRRDIVFSGVVQEEIGGAGAKFWVENLDYPVDLVVLAEPSSNRLSLGHRGLRQIWVTFHGRSAHASVPEAAVNPNYALARFLQALDARRGELAVHEVLGPTTVSPTLIEVDTKSRNVTPAWARVMLDFRTAAESPRSLANFIRELAGDASITLEDGFCSDPTPLEEDEAAIYGFYTPPDSEIVTRARALIAAGTGRLPALSRYNFATDGRHFVPYGLPIIGYAPGDEDQAHIANEKISIAAMEEGLRGYVGLLLDY
jgi:putative selenium metabolism hydrolase